MQNMITGPQEFVLLENEGRRKKKHHIPFPSGNSSPNFNLAVTFILSNS